MEKYFVYKDVYVNDEYSHNQEKPDICDSMECAIETVIDAVKHLTGIDLSKDEIEMFENMEFISIDCGNNLKYRFYLDIKY